MAVVDIHNHLMPGVDDGATDTEQALSGLRAMLADGVGALIVTPHLNGALTRQPAELEARLSDLDAAWKELRSAVSAEFPTLDLRRAVELRLDHPDPDLGDPRIRVDGGAFILVEFPFSLSPSYFAKALTGVRMKGFHPILAHPERYSGIDPKLAVVADWRRSGAHFQVNAASLLGRYGPDARRIALALLAEGWVDYLASDYHSRGRPRVAEARELLIGMGGSEQAELLLETNPSRLLAGEPPLPVPPLRARRGVLRRIFEVFR